MSRRDHPRNRPEGSNSIVVGPTKRVRRIFDSLYDERGTRNENNFLSALISLQGMGMPIMFNATIKRSVQDRQGIDVMIYGTKPLYLERIGIDVKSSRREVDLYIAQQAKVEEEIGELRRMPRYPFQVLNGEGGNSCRLLQALAIFILEKSQSHTGRAGILKGIDPHSKNGMSELAALIEKIFSEDQSVE